MKKIHNDKKQIGKKEIYIETTSGNDFTQQLRGLAPKKEEELI